MEPQLLCEGGSELRHAPRDPRFLERHHAAPGHKRKRQHTPPRDINLSFTALMCPDMASSQGREPFSGLAWVVSC